MKLAYLRVCSIRKLEDELLSSIEKLCPSLDVLDVSARDPVLCVKYLNKLNNVDVIHATGNTASILAKIKKFRNFIVTVHDLIPLVYSTHIADSSKSVFEIGFRSLIYRYIKKILESDNIATIVAISKFTRNEILRLTNVSKNKIRVVYWGIDHQRYHLMDKVKCRNMLNLNKDMKYILVVASNLRHKRMDLVIEIFNKIQKYRDDVILLKAGYGEKLFGRNIINVGYVPEHMMPMLYNSADVFVHTAEYEGFGLPILEAMACGTPIVASNKASIPEILGNGGYLIDIDSDNCVDKFVSRILDILDDDPENVNWAGIRRSKRFSWEFCARKYLKIYGDFI